MKTCPKCDAENPDEAKFCNLCFADFEAEEGERREPDVGEEGGGQSGDGARCPNCGEIGPASAEFCGRCGYSFSGVGREIVETQQQVNEAQAKLDTQEEETKKLREKPLTVTPGTDGAELMRRLSESLEQGYRPRLRAAGKEPIAIAMKLLARLSEEFRARDRQLWVQADFVDSQPVRHLEELEVELVLVVSARGS